MTNSTQTIWRKTLATLLLCFVSAAAFATNFGLGNTTFNTNDLNGTYDVHFDGCENDGMYVEVVNISDYVLVDATGTKVPYSFVVPEMKDNFTVSFTVAGVEGATSGTYYIKVPVAAFCLSFMPNITSDAFDVTLNLASGSEPVDPGTDVDVPENHDGEIVFTLDDHKSDTSLYFHDGDIVESTGAGVFLKFDRVGIDYMDYTTSYKSNGGFVQFKDCAFTISAPVGTMIQKVVFEDAAPTSTMYDIDNIDAVGCSEGVWTGNAQSVSFKTKEIQYANYDYDDEDNEYITGYTTVATGARVKKIYVTLDKVLDGIAGIASKPADSAVFDLAGRRVNAASQQGIMIVGGKKVIR